MASPLHKEDSSLNEAGILSDDFENDLSELYEEIIDKSFSQDPPMRPDTLSRMAMSMKPKRKSFINKPTTDVPKTTSENQATENVTETTERTTSTNPTSPTTTDAFIQEESTTTPGAEPTEMIEQSTTEFIPRVTNEKPKPRIARIIKGKIF